MFGGRLNAESITQDELKEALRQRGWKDYSWSAQSIFEHVKKNREPEYEVGKAYIDADGVYYLRCVEGWLFCATGKIVDFPPTSPIRKLVPESTGPSGGDLDL